MKNRLLGKLNKQLIEYPKFESDGTDEVISVEKKGVGHILEQNSTDLIFRVELKPSPRLVYINPACLRITGYTQEEFYANQELLDKMVHPDDLELVNRFKKFDGEKPDKTVMLRWIRKDGKQIWTQQARTIIRDEKRQPAALYIVVKDITEDLQTRLDLEAMEEKFLKTFQASPNPICIIDLETDAFLDVNEGFTRFSGYTREEIIGRTPLDLNLHVNREDIATMKSILAKEGRMYKLEFSNRVKSGEIRAVLFSAEIIAIGGKLCVVFVLTDITDQKRLEEASHESEEKYKALFDNVNAIVVGLDKRGYIVEANTKAVDLFGIPREDVMGKHFAQINVFKPEEFPRLLLLFKEAMGGKASGFIDNVEALNKNGESFFVNIYYAVTKKGDEITGVVCILHDITAEKKAEAAKRESEEKYKTIFNSIGDIVARIDRRGKITEVNFKVGEIYGFRRDEILGKRLTKLNIFTVKDLPRLVDVFSNIVRGKLNYHQEELETKDKSGRPVFIDAKITAVRKNGKVEGVVALVSDITERKKTQQALMKSEDKFTKIFNSSPNPMCITALDGRKFIDVNDSFLVFSGYSREEIIGRTAVDLNLWVGGDDPQTLVKKIFETGNVYNFEVNSRRKSGEIRTGLFSGNIIEIDGKLCMALMVTDITEQKWAEEALRESEEFTSSLLKNNPTPIFVAYPDASIKYVNPAFEKLTGYSLSDVIGAKRPYPWWPEDAREEISARFHETAFGTGAKKEMNYCKKNGERFWVEVHASHINQNADKIYTLINWVDITERKEIELTWRESEEKLSKAFNASPDCIAISRLDDGQYIEVNDSFVRLTGYSRDYILSKSFNNILKWDENGSREKIMAKLRTSGRVVKEECSFCTKSGDIKTMWYSAETLKIRGVDCVLSITTDITERITATKALEESESKFRNLAEQSPNMIFINKNGRIVYANKKCEEVMGYTREEFYSPNFNFLSLIAPKHRDNVQTNFTTHMKNLDIPPCEYLLIAKDGSEIDCILSSKLISYSGGTAILGTITDITERKRVEKKLQESQEKFSKAFNSASNAMAIFSTKGGKFVEVNDSYVTLSGYSREEIIGRNADELNMWVNQNDRLKILHTVKETGRVHQMEFGFRAKSNEVRTCLFSAEPFHISGEDRMIVVVQDITQGKQIENALRESEEKFSKAFSASANAICLASLDDDKIIEVNESFCRSTGYSREEVLGHTPRELKILTDEKELAQFENLIKRDGKFQNLELHTRTKSGDLRIGLASAEVINIGGRQCRIVAITDITGRKQMEKALLESEEKFSKAFSASTNAICISRISDNTFIDVNDGFCRFTGYSRQEIIGRSSAQLNLWTEGKEIIRFKSQLEKEGKFQNLEIHSRTKSGDVRVGLFSAEVINIGGLPCRIVAITDITERKKIEEALRESEEKFSKAFHGSPGAIGISTLDDGKFIDVNEGFLKIMGYTPQEAIGRTSEELGLWVGDNGRDDLLSKLGNTETPHNSRVEFRRKSGEVGWGMFSAQKIVINNEPCLITVNMDVTEQKKAEERSRLLSSVTQQVTDSIIVTDPRFRITYMNKAAQDLYGYSLEELLGKQMAVINAEPAQKQRKEIRTVVSQGNTWSGIIVKKRKDGSTFLCESHLSPMYDEKGQITSYIVVNRDITEQKRIEAEIKGQTQLIENILSSMPEGVLVLDSTDRVMLANESLRKIFHISRKALQGKALNLVINVEQLFDLYTSIRNGRAENQSIEFRYKYRDQEQIIVCAIIKMDNDHMLLIFSDVSHEREEEDKLYLTDRLASLGQMAAGLAHELNNPLTGILTLSHLLVNSDIPAEHKEDLQCVYSEAKRAANIVKNVLLFTRNNNYENGMSSVNEAIRELFRLREHEENAKNIRVVTNLQENLSLVPLDKYQLQQVFLNIILNAEAAIEETKRPGTITVSTERVNSHITIKITDDGCGIKKQFLPRIFDPFFTTKEIGKGTGLGLSICYGIIVKHNGKISVKTQIGKGTTFTIKIPVAAENGTTASAKGE